jgi:hypothetical protein
MYCAIRSPLSITRKHGLNRMDSIKPAFAGAPLDFKPDPLRRKLVNAPKCGYFSTGQTLTTIYQSMKTLFLSLLALAPAMVIASPDLKLELIAPEGPITISQKQVALLENLPEEIKALEAAQNSDHADAKEVEAMVEKVEKARAVEQGIKMILRFTNSGKEPIQLFYGSDSSRNVLKIVGPRAFDVPYHGNMTREIRIPKATEIKAGESKDFVVMNLVHGGRDMDRWYITKPGTYHASVQFIMNHENSSMNLTSNQVTFEVKLASE